MSLPISYSIGPATSSDEQRQPAQLGNCIEHWHPSRSSTFLAHSIPETTVDLGEIRMNYAVLGSPSNPALLLIPGQTESWWGYEAVMHLLAPSYHVFAVDLRGQGRSTWTPGRYTLDIFGNDLVRFLDLVVGRPAIVAGLSSGGILSAWLSAFSKPGQVRAAIWEDPPLFASERTPAVGQSIRQTLAGPMFRLWAQHLGPQWSVGDEDGLAAAMKTDMPAWIAPALEAAAADNQTVEMGGGPKANMREYDPEWAAAFWTGTVGAGCDHAAMLPRVRVPVLFTHHYRRVDAASGNLLGAVSDLQVAHARSLVVEGAGGAFEVKSFPRMPHSMHGSDPVTYVTAVTEWMGRLGLGTAIRPTREELEAVQEKIKGA